MKQPTYWWPRDPYDYAFTCKVDSHYSFDATSSPWEPVLKWKRYLYTYEPGTTTHYLVPDLFAILHGIGLYNDD